MDYALAELLIGLGAVLFGFVQYVDSKIDPLTKELSENTKETRAIKTEIVGISGANGIKSEIKAIKADIKDIAERLSDVEHPKE